MASAAFEADQAGIEHERNGRLLRRAGGAGGGGCGRSLRVRVVAVSAGAWDGVGERRLVLAGAWSASEVAASGVWSCR